MLFLERMRFIVVAGLLVSGLCGCATQQQTEVVSTLAGSTPSEAPKVAALKPEAIIANPTPAALALPTAPVSPAKVPQAKAADCFHLRPIGAKGSGRCEPQSLPYGRCRSGIMSCRLGKENGPLTWFACEQKRGKTGNDPRPGSILVLAANAGHAMPTGHIMYVEAVHPITPTTYKLILSHTNYDRKCSLETNIEAIYNRATMSLDLQSGAWKAWGRGLKLAGFILN